MTDAGKTVLEGTFTGATASDAISVFGRAAATIEDGVGTVVIERSNDGGTNWVVASKNADGDPASYVTNSDMAFNGVIDEPETQVLYRFNCTAFGSGTIKYRLAN